MSRPTRRIIPTLTQSRSNSRVLSGCRSLVPIDSEPLKRAEQEKCRSALHKMDLARARLRRFVEESQPAFQRWLYSTFGREMTELRDLESKFEEHRILIHEVEHYKFTHECSYREAYQQVMERRNNPSKYLEEDFLRGQGYGDGGGDDFRDHAFRDDEEERAAFDGPHDPRFADSEMDFEEEKLFREFLDSMGMSADEIDEPESHFNDSKSRESKLKDLYRALVRKLHPDINLDLDERRKELWHQVQEAYAAQDLERLETLSAMNDVFDGSIQSTDSVWSLKILYEDLRFGLRQLERQIRQCTKNISWGFDKTLKKPEKLQRIRRRIADDMEQEKYELIDLVAYGERKIESWKKSPSKKRVATKQRRER